MNGDAELLIYHVFADTGIESEPLSAYGRVVRLGLDPLNENPAYSQPVQGDAEQCPLAPGADLALLHPPCPAFSNMTHLSGDQADHPNLIPHARQLGNELADAYIIENVPAAPLHDPVVLSGTQFGLPIPYRRAFETSFHVEQPPKQATLTDHIDRDGPFAREGHPDGYSRVGEWTGSKALWRTAKQVTGDYAAKDLKRHGIPAPYIHYLVRWYLRSLG